MNNEYITRRTFVAGGLLVSIIAPGFAQAPAKEPTLQETIDWLRTVMTPDRLYRSEYCRIPQIGYSHGVYSSWEMLETVKSALGYTLVLRRTVKGSRSEDSDRKDYIKWEKTADARIPLRDMEPLVYLSETNDIGSSDPDFKGSVPFKKMTINSCENKKSIDIDVSFKILEARGSYSDSSRHAEFIRDEETPHEKEQAASLSLFLRTYEKGEGQDLPKRIQKALEHAIRLSGGKVSAPKKEPF